MSFLQKNVLALNPFHGGSHKSFIENWISRSCHSWDLLTLRDRCWKWRLNYAVADFSSEITDMYNQGKRWDAVFCTSMMNAAELRGFLSFLIDIPLIVYFHENQLTYPESKFHKYDQGLCAVNVKSALAADEIWFNSEFHQEDFLKAANDFVSRNNSKLDISSIREKSRVEYQAVADDFLCQREALPGQPLRLVWASRWEEEKNPGLFFLALRELKKRGVEFRISVIGEEMRTRMACFTEAEEEFKGQIDHFGYAESRNDYRKILQESDIFISTAEHEFFGISAVEAVAAGCIPVVPDHLAYPEVLKDFKDFFYKPRSSVQLAERVIAASASKGWQPGLKVTPYLWSVRAPSLDKSLSSCER